MYGSYGYGIGSYNCYGIEGDTYNIDDHSWRVRKGRIELTTDGIVHIDEIGNRTLLFSNGQLMSIFGNPLLNELFKLVSSPGADPIERLVNERILEVINSATERKE